jgi:hypothetical protein
MMKPLSQKVRFRLIVLSLFLFIIIAPIILANSFGYRIESFDDIFNWTKTGGIYLHSNIDSAAIFIDGKYHKDSGRLLRNTLIQDLNPNKTYEIVIIKEGLNDWRKSLTVYPSIVTEAATLMLPKDISDREIYPHLDNFRRGTTTPLAAEAVVLDVEKVAADFDLDLEMMNKLSLNYIPTNPEYAEIVNVFLEEEVFETNRSGVSLATPPVKESLITIEENDSSITTEDLISDLPEFVQKLGLEIESLDELNGLIELSHQVAWIENGNIVVNWVDENTSPAYYYCLNPEECREQITIDWSEEIKDFRFMSGFDEFIVILVDGGIYATEVDDRSPRNIQPVYGGNNLEFTIVDGQIVVLNGGIFYELDL